MPDKPLVFISCGQFTDEEKALGKAVEQLIREHTAFEPYSAEQQNTLEGLVTNILSALNRCAAFIGIMHHRGTVDTPSGKVFRGSVWIEQEVALAAFIQHALKRRIEVALYMQAGISLEGIRQQLRLKPFEFTSSKDVLLDLKERIVTWRLSPSKRESLVAEWSNKILDRHGGERHDCRLEVTLHNNGATKVDDWRADIWFPTAFLSESACVGKKIDGDCLHKRESSTEFPPGKSRLYPNDRFPVFSIPYYIDYSNWTGRNTPPAGCGSPEPTIRIRVCAGDMEPFVAEIPISQLDDF